MKTAFEMKVGEYSEVIESFVGLHLIKVTDRRPGKTPFEDVQHMMKIWLEKKAYLDAIEEARAKHPIVGVNEPLPPPHLRELIEQENATTQPATQTAPE